jgi:hypothetical protein
MDAKRFNYFFLVHLCLKIEQNVYRTSGNTVGLEFVLMSLNSSFIGYSKAAWKLQTIFILKPPRNLLITLLTRGFYRNRLELSVAL